MTKLQSVNKELMELYRSIKPTKDFLIADYSYRMGYSELENLKIFSKRKKLYVKDIIPISSQVIPCFSINVKLNKKKAISATDKTGIFKVVFSDDSFLLFSYWWSGLKKTGGVESLVVGEKETWMKYLKMSEQVFRLSQKPKVGIYDLQMTGTGQLIYTKKDKLFSNEVIHQNFSIIEKDIDFYFNNVELFTRFNMPGIRKGLIIGEPGTGKTITGIKLAQKYAKEKCVIYANNMRVVVGHLQLCKKYKVSTLLIFEDAEYILNEGGSTLLNVLDGMDQPRMVEGAYILMSTNYPEVIENRILKRPGRIDKIIHMGSLTGEYAYNCFKLYAKGIYSNEDLQKEKLIISIVNNLTGAQIRELVNASLSYAVANQKDITLEILAETVKIMTEIFDKLPEYSKQNSKMVGKVKTDIGFLKAAEIITIDDIPTHF